MGKLIFIILLLAFSLAGFVIYVVVNQGLEMDPAIRARIDETFGGPGNKGAKAVAAIVGREEGSAIPGKEEDEIAAVKETKAPGEAIVLHMKSGNVIAGKLIRKTDTSYVVNWKDGECVIDFTRVKKAEFKDEKEIDWPFNNDVVVKRLNGVVSDGEIIEVDDDFVTLLFTEGGGGMELGINRDEIDTLMFAPVYSKESVDAERRLRAQFPKMKVYKEGNVTIFTDSYTRWVNLYKTEINDVYTEIYLKFFRLFKEGKPQMQNFVIIFDDWNDFADYALTDGVPPWYVRGYFSPVKNVLCIYNAFGQRIEQLVHDGLIDKAGAWADNTGEAIKGRVDKTYHTEVDGLVETYKGKTHSAYNTYKHYLSEGTIATLRHEFAHEVFHNWGLQNIVLSKPQFDKDELARKKKEFMETDDPKKKRELLEKLIGLQKEDMENLKMDAAQSWLSEGVATFSETDPIGGENRRWLSIFQEMLRNNEVNPIEFLMVFKMGSFPGLAPKGMINAYAQSWALTTLLMDRYPDRMVNYQIMIARQKPKDDNEELEWLLGSLEKELPELQEEFIEYMRALPEVEDPYVKIRADWYKIWE
ncbi:MAG: hypothetical protein ABID09_02985 [Candidatus Omnitrophota bacterium]